MSGGAKPLAPGLYFVATPIGSARDVTLRALDILKSADVIAAEDTRTLRKLMKIHDIPLSGRRLIAYHDHNGAQVRPRLLSALAEGKSLAYASEAGTPTVADPGFVLARAAIAAGRYVTTAPGASAVMAALTVSGLATDRFLFAGFAPPTSAARRRYFAGFSDVPATLIFFESPRRIHKSLADMALELGEDRPAALCRELTKKFEEVLRTSLGDMCRQLAGRRLRGEIVVLVDRNRAATGDEGLEDALMQALKTLSVRDAATEVAGVLGLPRRKVYQTALKMEKPE
ncbi:MAG: 16S rRNA (cytidine(1402)-2'-O)-methyltransferase [Paracoccaceae bacterium]